MCLLIFSDGSIIYENYWINNFLLNLQNIWLMILLVRNISSWVFAPVITIFPVVNAKTVRLDFGNRQVSPGKISGLKIKKQINFNSFLLIYRNRMMFDSNLVQVELMANVTRRNHILNAKMANFILAIDYIIYQIGAMFCLKIILLKYKYIPTASLLCSIDFAPVQTTLPVLKMSMVVFGLAIFIIIA